MLPALSLLLLAPLVAQGKLVTFDNNAPRLDVHGNIIDAHDGSIQRFTPDGPYYMHAMQYGLCKEPDNYGCDQTPDKCGFRLDHNISVWVSPDLSSGSWVYAGNAIAIADRPAGTVYRPHAVYNPNTNEYVLWWNYVTPTGQYNGYAVAVSSTPVGPFRLVNEQVNITRLKGGAGDFDLFVDYNVTLGRYVGYVIYSAAYYTSIEELTPDFYDSTGRTAQCTPEGAAMFAEYFTEAPVMFKRNGTYYALFGHCCCFCYQGSGAYVHTAPTPLGPWKVQSGDDIICYSGCPAAQATANTSHTSKLQAIASSSSSSTSNMSSSSALPSSSPPSPSPRSPSSPSSSCTRPSPYGAKPTPGQGCLYESPTDLSSTRSQQNFVIEVPTATGLEYVWTGDRWQQAPDGIKGHDPQFWVPLKFAADGSIARIEWVDSFTLDVL